MRLTLYMIHVVFTRFEFLLENSFFWPFGSFDSYYHRSTLDILLVFYLVQYFYHLRLQYGEFLNSHFSTYFLTFEN